VPEAYPSSLQQCANTDFNEVVIPSYLSSDMDIGPQKKRVRFTRQRYSMTFTITATVDQYNTFIAWGESTLAFYTRSFYFDHPITKVQKVYSFKEPPEISAIGPLHFSITMNLEES